jgi:hypothetical protein
MPFATFIKMGARATDAGRGRAKKMSNETEEERRNDKWRVNGSDRNVINDVTF